MDEWRFLMMTYKDMVDLYLSNRVFHQLVNRYPAREKYLRILFFAQLAPLAMPGILFLAGVLWLFIDFQTSLLVLVVPVGVVSLLVLIAVSGLSRFRQEVSSLWHLIADCEDLSGACQRMQNVEKEIVELFLSDENDAGLTDFQKDIRFQAFSENMSEYIHPASWLGLIKRGS